MKKYLISILAKMLIIAFAFIGLYACAVWYPITVVSDSLFDSSEPKAHVIIQLAFYIGVSIPCFTILLYAWKVARAIKNDTVFTAETANFIKKCTAILLIDDIFFAIGNTVFMLLGWNKYALYYFLLAALGMVAVTVLYVLFYYVKEAAELKEEIDLTI